MYSKSFGIQWLLASMQLLTLVAAMEEIYGDIYPNTRAELKVYYNVQNKENKCYKHVPSIFFQTKENEPIMGNSSILDYHSLEICCKGFKKSPQRNGTCVPDCSTISPDNCRNGFCRSPQYCECFEGFVKNAEGKCVHTCPVTCDNGHCLLDGRCICYPGYSLEPDTRKYCIPDCSRISCGLNQQCVAPGECRCKAGYMWLDTLGCQPICQPHCGLGRCVAPNECECFPGFIKRPERNICEAECFINCRNGFCESRYKCQCHVGFRFDQRTQSCLPYCPHGCEHGVCIAPGICQCFEGYFLYENNCLPICEDGCGQYGRCIAPNICACGSGRIHCLAGGICTYLGQCYCAAGMIHFIDRCLYSSDLNNMIYKFDEMIHFNRQLKYEFHALVGRFFQFY